MQAQISVRSNDTQHGEIAIILPNKALLETANAISGLLKYAGIKVKRVNEAGEELIPADEVFPNSSPAFRLRGLRAREDISQEELAEKLGISQSRVSDLESGKKPISLAMAKKIGEAYNISYKVFL